MKKLELIFYMFFNTILVGIKYFMHALECNMRMCVWITKIYYVALCIESYSYILHAYAIGTYS